MTDRPGSQDDDGIRPREDTDDATEAVSAMTAGAAAEVNADRVVWAELFRPALEEMIEPIVALIRSHVPPYDGPTDGRRHQLMRMAGHEAITAFLDRSSEGDSRRRKVEELFRKMGWGESQAGNGIQSIQSALEVATRGAWDRLSAYAVDHHLPVVALRDATQELHLYTDHLHEELVTGHTLSERSPAKVRESLIDLLRVHPVSRTSPRAPHLLQPAVLAQMAEAAQWPLPDRVTVIAVRADYLYEHLKRRPELLCRVDGDVLMIVCAASHREELIDGLEFTTYPPPIVYTWPVSPIEAGSAMAWAIRTLDLMEAGVVPRGAQVECRGHITQLWLHAEPSMRRQLCADLLTPLLAETHNSREILSDTLLTWLETRESAPALAARLDVHPQTVRYRWRRINELFGEALHEPEFVTQITMVLKASLPMWKAGDHTDFDLSRESREADK